MVAHSPSITKKVIGLLRPIGRGLEIAPYYDPFLVKSINNDVSYTDYISTEEIRAKANLNPGGKDADICAIDFVWVPGENLKNCAPNDAKFDYAVASHVMEHVPNPVGWLNEILSVVVTGGRLAIFLPIRETNFDMFRELTTFAELVDLWILQPAGPTARQVLEFMSEAVDQSKLANLGPEFSRSAAVRPYTDDQAIDSAVHIAQTKCYLDVHATVWNPIQFVEVFSRIVDCGLMNVVISEVVHDELEFALVFTKVGEPTRLPPVLPKTPQIHFDGAIRQLRGEMVIHLNHMNQDLVHRFENTNEAIAIRQLRNEIVVHLEHMNEALVHRLEHTNEALVHRLNILLERKRRRVWPLGRWVSRLFRASPPASTAPPASPTP